jgi:hypothetical protein
MASEYIFRLGNNLNFYTKKMKKIILTLALVAAAATSAMAQFSVGAGYLNQNVKSTYTSGSSTSTSNTGAQGFYVGADAAYNLGYGVSVVPGIYYGYLGNDSASSVAGLVGAEGSTKSHYIAVPVNFKYGIGLGDLLNVFAYAGPQFELGVSSKTTYTAVVLGQSASSTVDNYSGDDSHLNRFNISLGAGIGVDVAEMVRVNFGYHYGLLNMYKGSDSNYKINNSYWSVGAAFLF